MKFKTIVFIVILLVIAAMVSVKYIRPFALKNFSAICPALGQGGAPSITMDNQFSRESGLAVKEVYFKYEAPTAKQVYLSGEFNDWQLELMVKDGNVWSIKKYLPRKETFLYQFIVDGIAQSDPLEKNKKQDPVKGECSVIAVPGYAI